MSRTMSDNPPLPPEPLFDRTRPLNADGPPDPVVYDGSVQALRQRTINFAAKRFADMMYVTGLDRGTAERHFRWRAASVPGGLSARPVVADGSAALAAAQRDGRIVLETNDTDRRVTVRWQDPALGHALTAQAIARPGYGGILLGPHAAPHFEPAPIDRRAGEPGRAWPLGDAADPPRPVPALDGAADALFAGSAGNLRRADRHAGARSVRALQRVRPCRPRYPELVDDQGDHLHGDRADDARGLAGFGVRSRAGSAVARSPRGASSHHHRPPAAHALRAGVSGAARRWACDARVREQRRVSGCRGCVRCGAARDRRDRAGLGVPLRQQRTERAGRDDPRPHRVARTSLSCDAVWPAGRSAGDAQLPALRGYRRQSDRVRRGVRDPARLRQAGRAVLAGWCLGR